MLFYWPFSNMFCSMNQHEAGPSRSAMTHGSLQVVMGNNASRMKQSRLSFAKKPQPEATRI